MGDGKQCSRGKGGAPWTPKKGTLPSMGSWKGFRRRCIQVKKRGEEVWAERIESLSKHGSDGDPKK